MGHFSSKIAEMAKFRYSQNFTRNSGISILIENSASKLVLRQQFEFILSESYFSVQYEYYSTTKLHILASYFRKKFQILRNFRGKQRNRPDSAISIFSENEQNSGIFPLFVFRYLDLQLYRLPYLESPLQRKRAYSAISP